MRHAVRNWLVLIGVITMAATIALVIVNAILVSHINKENEDKNSKTSTSATSSTKSSPSPSIVVNNQIEVKTTTQGTIHKINHLANISPSPYPWRFDSPNVYNTMSVGNTMSSLNSTNALYLNLGWYAELYGSVSSSPTLEGNKIWITDDVGYIYCFELDDGRLVWKRKLSFYTHFTESYSTSSPTIYSDSIIISDASSGMLVRLRKKDGELVWKKNLDPSGQSIILQTPLEYAGSIYVGLYPNTNATTFRGSFISIDANSGKINFRFYTLPEIDNQEMELYTGAGIIGSSASIDQNGKIVYFTTGKLLTMPSVIRKCVHLVNDSIGGKNNCFGTGILHNSLIGLDVKTGAVKYHYRNEPYDSWIESCKSPINCPKQPNMHNEFAHGPISIGTGHVFVAQQTGVASRIDTIDNTVIWTSHVGPGGNSSGFGYGSSTNGKYIITTNPNTEKTKFTLIDDTMTDSGFWSAIDATSGKLIWQTPDPSGNILYASPVIVNNIVICSSSDSYGHIFFLNIETGRIVAVLRSDSPVIHHPIVTGNTLYVGTGIYENAGFIKGSGKKGVSAFSVQIY
jgi:polyvinyl alcohol dehydrogenase (cytochrome)